MRRASAVEASHLSYSKIVHRGPAQSLRCLHCRISLDFARTRAVLAHMALEKKYEANSRMSFFSFDGMLWRDRRVGLEGASES